MEPSIQHIADKKLVGFSKEMSLIEDKTAELFKQFMPRRNEIQSAASNHIWDLKVYSIDYFDTYNPARSFTKWALMEVKDWQNIPVGMSKFRLTGGDYAVFKYQGLITDNRIFQYIFTEWLPGADYQLDNRPHFDLLSTEYHKDDPDAISYIWIPVQKR